MSKKYWEFTGEVRVEEGVELKQIRAVCSFGVVVEGDLGAGSVMRSIWRRTVSLGSGRL